MERYPSPLLGRFNTIFRQKEKTWVFRVPTKSPKIEQHQIRFYIGSVLCIENFGVSLKSEKSFEKGDMPVAIKIESTIAVNVVEGKDNEFVPKFYHTDSIGEFQKRHEQWA